MLEHSELQCGENEMRLWKSNAVENPFTWEKTFMKIFWTGSCAMNRSLWHLLSQFLVLTFCIIHDLCFRFALHSIRCHSDALEMQIWMGGDKSHSPAVNNTNASSKCPQSFVAYPICNPPLSFKFSPFFLQHNWRRVDKEKHELFPLHFPIFLFFCGWLSSVIKMGGARIVGVADCSFVSGRENSEGKGFKYLPLRISHPLLCCISFSTSETFFVFATNCSSFPCSFHSLHLLFWPFPHFPSLIWQQSSKCIL